MPQKIISHPSTQEYRSNWERIFGVSYASFKQGDIVRYHGDEVVFVSFSPDTCLATVRDFAGEYHKAALEELERR